MGKRAAGRGKRSANRRALQEQEIPPSWIAVGVAMVSRITAQTAQSAVPDPDLWRDFADAFRALTTEQDGLVNWVRRGDRRLRAYCGYNSDMTADEFRLVEGGLLWLLYRIESGTWQLSAGPNQDFKTRFEALATRAGIALQCPNGFAALDFWLHRLCCHLQTTNSKGLFARTSTGSYIENVCQTSATFCSWLEAKTLEAQRSAPEQDANKAPNAREALVMPNLAERGWSIHRLAVEANVDFHTVNDYLKGRTQPNRSTRKQLAEALGIPVQQLPE
jgi:lambda repressor-like predicted transcriptional regulator